MTSNTQKLDEEVIKNIKILRSHALSYRQIADLLRIGYGSVQKYAKNVTFLPKSMRKNPFELLSPQENPTQYEKRVIDPENYIDEANKEYWIEQHEEGTRFEAPINLFSLKELWKIMEEPTDYISNYSMKDWADHYLEGEKKFLKTPPHKWSDGQREIFDLWEEQRKMMIETHRAYGKTVAGTAIITREICENRENSYAICSQSEQTARARLKQIADTLIKNKKIIADYGFLPNIQRFKGIRQAWTQEEITVKRDIPQTDPTLMCFSSKSKLATGYHYDGILYDDVWSREFDRNPMNKDKWLEWFDGELEGCLEDAWELWLLTRKSPNDLYQTIEDRNYYVIYKRPAIIKFPSKYHYEYKTVQGQQIFDKVVVETDDWELSCPDRFSIEFLLEKKLKMNPTEWESEYQLNPMSRHGRYWQWQNLQEIPNYTYFMDMIKAKRDERRSRIIGSMDLAMGTSARADYSALVLIGFFEHKYYFLELLLKRGATENEWAKMIAEAKRMFPDLESVYIEADFEQSAKVARLKKKAPFVHIMPVFARQEQAALQKATPENRETNLTGKPLRIWAQLEGIIEDRKLYINKNMRNFKEFKDEFITFPRCEHFDVLDALASGVAKMERKGALIYALSG